MAHVEEEGSVERVAGTGDPEIWAKARPALGHRQERGGGERPQRYRHTL